MTMSRFMRLATVAMLAGATTMGRAAERTPYPAFTGERVYTSGVPDRFDALGEHITRLEKSSPQTYYVAVVKSFGDGPDSALDYVRGLYRVWRSEASRRGL
jgi:uncharacterized membrane protein YgcG